MENTADTISNNRLIASFMGGEYKTDLPFSYIKSGWVNTPANNYVQVAQDFDFKYHTSWDWLMPVVEKIYIDRRVKEISIRPGRTRIWFSLKHMTFIESPCKPENTSIYECWIVVVEFIKWHNSQKVT